MIYYRWNAHDKEPRVISRETAIMQIVGDVPAPKHISRLHIKTKRQAKSALSRSTPDNPIRTLVASYWQEAGQPPAGDAKHPEIAAGLLEAPGELRGGIYNAEEKER